MTLGDLFFWGVGAVGCFSAVRAYLESQAVGRLPPGDLTPPEGRSNERVAVIVPARNEAARVERAIGRLLSQTGVDLEIIAVDDRSTDETGAILQRIAADNRRVKVVHIQSLPEGWLGKSYACHVGTQKVAADWLLFTDADVWLKPDVIQRALAVARRDNAQHITLTPGVKRGTLAGQGWHLLFLMGMGDWIEKVNRDHPTAFIGIGAFNLVATRAYQACGGYPALKMTVVDDVKLGLLMRRSGFRTRAFIGGDDVPCDWSPAAMGMIKIMEKNIFAAVNYNTIVAFSGAALMAAFWLAGIIGPWLGTPAGFAAGAGLLCWMLPGAGYATRLGWPLWTGLTVPLAMPFMALAMLNSALVTLRQGGVRWRDTFSPLATLRAGNVK